MRTICFWNNKGGTGKTSLLFQAACRWAEQHPDEHVLVIDMCPQANASELLLGGLTDGGSDNLLRIQGNMPRATVGGYFQHRLANPYTPPKINPDDFVVHPHQYNQKIPENLDLVCGDPLLELQANAMSTLAINQIPGTNTWIKVMEWLSDLLEPLRERYQTAFVDANPSFAVYTQMALAASDELVLPVMADDSSRRAIQNVFSLVYGFRVPSEIYTQHAFATRMEDAGKQLPRVRVVVKNRLTQYMGPASAYADVLSSIERNVTSLHRSHPILFAVTNASDLFVEIRDFQTTGVVAFAKGCPFSRLRSGRIALVGRRVRVNEEYRMHCVEAIDGLLDRLRA